MNQPPSGPSGISKRDPAAAGAPGRCPTCGRESDPPAPFDRDQTVRRTMLMPQLPPLDDDTQLVCRLEPVTLRWQSGSEGLARLLGAVAEVEGRSFLDWIHPDDRGRARREFDEVLVAGERPDFLLRMRVVGEQVRHFRFFIRARYRPDGRIHQIRCSLSDVTDQIVAEEALRQRTEDLARTNDQLRRANQQLREVQLKLVHSERLAATGALAAGVAHEINNPLAFTTNNVAVIERDLGGLLEVLALHERALESPDAERVALRGRIVELARHHDLQHARTNLVDLAQATRRGLTRIAKLVECLRSFAQLDRAEVGEVHVNEAIEHCLTLLGSRLARVGIVVHRAFDTALPTLEGSVASLNEVLFQLLQNAVQAIEERGTGSGRIDVTTSVATGSIVVEIGDDGCGIPEENLVRIFEPFFTTRPVGQGTGLGLSLCHGIVAAHGGRIEVESRVSEGSLFRVFLPLRRGDPGTS
jgi:signal transduction histidine kinase